MATCAYCNKITSAFLGWWGFPWGLIMTPVPIGRNIAAMASGPDATRPSAHFEQIARLTLGNQIR